MIVGGCDTSQMEQSTLLVTRTEHNRVVAEAKKQKDEADRQRAEAQKWKDQATADHQLLEQVRGETGKIFDTLREEEQAKTAKVPSLQQANEDLVDRIHSLGKRVQNLEKDLAGAAKECKSLQEENQQLRGAKAPEAVAPSVVAPPVVMPPVVVPAPGPVAAPVAVSAGDRERQRLLAEAARELGEAKAVLAAPEKGQPSPPATQPVEGGEAGGVSPANSGAAASRPANVAPAAPGLKGAVVEARGARVRINLGAQNGLRKDTHMYVHRGSQFIGVLQLTTIEDQAAEGLVDGRLSAIVGDEAVVFGD